jgi:hypothetical protein
LILTPFTTKVGNETLHNVGSTGFILVVSWMLKWGESSHLLCLAHDLYPLRMEQGFMLNYVTSSSWFHDVGFKYQQFFVLAIQAR